MKKEGKRKSYWLLPLMCLLLFLICRPMQAEAESTLIQCGDNVYAEFDSDTGVMTISGTGAMWDGDAFDEEYYYRDRYGQKYPKANIYIVEIGNGITYIGNYAFMNCRNIKKLSIANTVEEIGICAFSNTKGLTSLNIPFSVAKIGINAFYSSGLQSIF